MIEQEIDIYRNKQTLKCWKVESMCGDLIILRRGKIVQAQTSEDFGRLFEGVA